MSRPHVRGDDEREFLRIALRGYSLTEEQILVFVGRLHGKTNAEIGLELGVGSERVRQHCSKAIRKLKHPTRWGSALAKGKSV